MSTERITDLLDRWAADCRAVAMSEQTIARYVRIVRQFADWLDEGAEVADIIPDLIVEYQRELAARGLAPRTIALTLSSIREFSRWCVRRRLRADDPTLLVEWPKLPKRKPRRLRAEELARLAEALSAPKRGHGRSAWQWARNRRAIYLMLYAGLRLGEVCALDWEHVDLDLGVLLVVNGKGAKDREVPISNELEAELRQVPLRQRRGAVVGRRDGQRQSEKTIAHIFARWLPGLGVEGVSAHRLRHTCASEMRMAGADLKDIQEVLGHESLATTEGYLGPDVDRLRRAVDALPPLAQMGQRRRLRVVK